jgi:hypothetical protein
MQRSVLGGGDGLFVVAGLGKADSVIAMRLFNNSKSPHYDVSLIRYDYDEISRCTQTEINGDIYTNPACMERSRTQISVPTIAKNGELSIEPLNFIGSRIQYKKFYIFIRSRSLNYIEEFYLTTNGFALRLFVMNGPKKNYKGYKPVQYES